MMITINDKTYITTVQAAELSGYSQAHIQALAASGTIKAQKIGRAWAIEKASLQNYGQAPVGTPKSSGSMTIKAMLLGHKMYKGLDGRVTCNVCRKSAMEINKDKKRCGK